MNVTELIREVVWTTQHPFTSKHLWLSCLHDFIVIIYYDYELNHISLIKALYLGKL